jgi:hypothetical protein
MGFGTDESQCRRPQAVAWLNGDIVYQGMACTRPGGRHNAGMGAPAFDRDEAGDPVYAFKPSLLGAISQFTLKPEALYWQIGRRSGRVRYERIRAVRLSYRPVTMQSHRFIAEIWSTDNPKVQIVSVSWRSMVQQQRLDSAYASFVLELHRRLAATGSTALFSTGLPVIVYWLGVVIFSGVLLATGTLAWRTVRSGQWGASAVIGIFFVTFVYQLGLYFRRNRPGRYRPDAVPQGLLPKT